MSVLVRFGSRKAILRWGEWWSADKDLERRLNDTTAQWIRDTGGPPLRDRDHEQTVAREMGGRFGGTVSLHIASGRAKSAQRFMEQRQMILEFPSSSPANTRRSKLRPAPRSQRSEPGS
jgi:hypothetical protein